MAYFAEVVQDLPLAYWRLGDTAGAQAADSSPNGRHGTWSGSPVLGSPGALDGDSDPSALFDGVDDRIALPALPSLAATLTLEFWCRPLSGGDATQCLIGEADGSPSVLFKPATGKLSVFYAGADHFNDTPLSFDTWHHIVVSIAAGAGTIYSTASPTAPFPASLPALRPTASATTTPATPTRATWTRSPSTPPP
ncbi:MAG TPA: LamG-like jellyroll fold domain-containing protein [Dehalococcoidia bacterium]|nr:LamG-like jellyroll fold domain-containing protein [Dehalococcoidia bacterium]